MAGNREHRPGRPRWFRVAGRTLPASGILLLLCVLHSPGQPQCWVYGKSGTAAYFSNASFADSLHGIALAPMAAGIGAGSYRTTDGGATWRRTPPPTSSEPLLGVSMVDTALAFGVDDLGRVFRTTNGGFGWQLLARPTTMSLDAVAFFDRNRGLIAGSGYDELGPAAAIWRTTNGGIRWFVQRVPGACSDIVWLDSLTALAAGQGIFRTTDAGASWSQVSSVQVLSLSFADARRGIAANPFAVYGSSDGGASWHLQSSFETGVASVCMPDTAREIAVGWSFIYSSTDGGSTWSALPLQGMPLTAVKFPDPRHGFVFGDLGLILRTSSAGCPYPSDVSVYPLDGYPSMPLGASGLPPHCLQLSWDCSVPYGLRAARVQLATGPDFLAGEMLADSLVPVGGSQFLNTSLQTGPLDKRKTYYWRLAWETEGGVQSAWSRTWSFTTSGASLSGLVYYDLNRSGRHEEAEPGIPHALLLLVGGGGGGVTPALETTILADSTGLFFIDAIDTGSYTLTSFVDSHWKTALPDTSVHAITVALPSDSLTGINSGWYYATNSVSGTVYQDLNENGSQDIGEPGLPGLRVRLHESGTNDSLLTDAGGHFTFESSPLGYNTISAVAPPGWEQIYPQFGQPYAYVVYYYGTHLSGVNFALHPVPKRVKVLLTATEANGIFTGTVRFGVRSGATPGIWRADPAATLIDYSEGEIELPPQQPGSFDVRFENPGGPVSGWQFGLGAWVDMRGVDLRQAAQADTFRVSFLSGTDWGGAYPVTFRWSRGLVASSFDGPVTVIAADGATLADMKSDSMLVVTNPDVTSFRIAASSPNLSALYAPGWNLVSLDSEPATRRVNVLFPLSTSSRVFAFDAPSGLYVPSDTISPGRGYWLKLSGATESFASLPGEGGGAVTSSMQDIAVGWNLIGAIGLPLSVGPGSGPGVATEPPGILSSHFFGYLAAGGGYVVADTLRPKRGYWVKARQAGTLLLGSPSFPASIARREEDPGTAEAAGPGGRDLLEAAGKLIVRSLQGEEARTVYFLRRDEALSAEEAARRLAWYEMPPPSPGDLSPEGGFDLRFASRRMLEYLPPHAVDPTPILLDAAAEKYPLVISWDIGSSGRRGGGTYLLSFGSSPASAVRREVALEEGKSIRLDAPVHSLGLRAAEGPSPAGDDNNNGTPARFSLSQNYPNPFNPKTEFRFELAEAGTVTLAIYDMLGREVEALVDHEKLEPGDYSRVWQAGSVASGVYYYRLTAGKFVAVRKMVVAR